MSRLDDLSPDQRAVLQLLLRQGKTYDELAALLRIDPAAVRSRASSALGALGPSIDEADRAELSDWLLGQQDELQAEDTLDLIGESPAALSWAIEVSDALREGGLEPRAELPDEIEDDVVDADAEEAPAPPAAPPGPAPVEPIPVAEARPREEAVAAGLPGFGRAEEPGPRPSRLGGILLIAGVAAIVVVLVVVLLTRGGDDGSDTVSAADTATAAQTSTTPTSTTQGQITVEAQVNMRPTASGGKALGVAQFFTDGKDHGVTVTAQGLEANSNQDVYALWLAGGTKTKADTLLGFSPSKVTKNGRFSGSITLPADAGDYREIILTRETQATPTKPGTVVLRGSLSG